MNETGTEIERIKELKFVASRYLPQECDEIMEIMDEEIARQQPCDACKNGTNGGKFTIDIKFGQRIHLNYHYCPTCGRKLRAQHD